MHIPPKSRFPLIACLVMLASLLTNVLIIILGGMPYFGILWLSDWMIPVIASLLYVIFAFAFANKNLVSFIIPLAMSVLGVILMRIFGGSWWLGAIPVIGVLVLPAVMLLMFCLTATGKIRTNIPLVIFSIMVLGFSIFNLASFARVIVQMGWTPFESAFLVYLTFVPNILFNMAYVILALGITRNPAYVPLAATAYQASPAGYGTAGYPPYNAGSAGGRGAAHAPEIDEYRANSYLGHVYSKLGGWLLLTVVGNIVGAVQAAALLALFSFLFAMLIMNVGDQGIFIVSMTVVGLAFLMVVVMRIVFAAMVIKRNPRFLRFYDICMIIDACAFIAIALIFMGMSGNAAFLGMIAAAPGALIGYIIWRVYYCRSLRVYIYMGSDEYLRRSVFSKNAIPPMIPSYVAGPQNAAAAPAYGATQSAATPSAAAQIRELFDLKEQGIISEDEFQRKKQDLLGIT